MIAGAVALPAAAEAATTITPNADFSIKPYNLSVEGGPTLFTFFKPTTDATAGAVNTYSNSIKAFITASGSTTPYALPYSTSNFASGSSISLTSSATDLFYLLDFQQGGIEYQANADVRNSFTLASVTYQAVSAASVPEPASLAILAAGAAGLLAARRRKSSGAAAA